LKEELDWEEFVQKVHEIARPSKFFPNYARANPKERGTGKHRAARYREDQKIKTPFFSPVFSLIDGFLLMTDFSPSFRSLLKTLFFYYRHTLLPTTNKSICFQTKDKGLGLMANSNMKLEGYGRSHFLLPDELWGVLFYIGDTSIWDELVKLQYPSLFQYNSYRGIFVGPASLLNHQCESPLTLQGTKLGSSNQQGISKGIYEFVGEGFVLVR
jgi:hypothetical protein